MRSLASPAAPSLNPPLSRRRSLYPSTLIDSCNPIGEPQIYSRTSVKNLFAASSSSPIYNSQEYIMTTLFHARAKLAKYEILSVHCSHIAGQIRLIPRQPFDCVIFAKRDGRAYMLCYQWDSLLHFQDAGRRGTWHESWCSKGGGGAGSERYKKTLRLAAWQKSVLAEVYGEHYEIVYERETHCCFHNSYRFNGVEYGGPDAAARAAGRLFPEMHYFERPFPKLLTLERLKEEMADESADRATFRAGFACVTGHLPLSDYNKRVGLVLGKRRIRREELSATFEDELERRIKLEFPDIPAEPIKRKFMDELCSAPRLVPSNSIDTGVVTLSYLNFLLKLGFVVERIDHLMLFPAVSRQRAGLHAFRNFIVSRSLQREELGRRLQRLLAEGGSKEDILHCRVFSAQIK